jgi:hypothetical protein
MCPHAGVVTIVSENETVLAEDGPLCTATDTFVVGACLLTEAEMEPCLTVAWLEPATRVFIGGVPALLTPSATITDGAEPGPATALVFQQRVWGT